MKKTSYRENEKFGEIAIILNANAGGADKQAVHQFLKDTFSAHGIKTHITLAKSGAEVAQVAERAAQSTRQIVVAGGGDGTINTVAAALVGTEKTLGILPLGTLNHLAKDLRIPLELDAAVRAIISGRTVSIDVGEVNGRIFLNNSSLGLYPKIVRHRKRRQRRGYGKWTAFLWAALKVFRRYPFLHVRLDVAGKEFSCRTPFVFIGNNEYEMDSLNMGGRSCLDRGQLSLYVTHEIGRLGLLLLALRALFGRLHTAKDFVAMCTTEVWVKTRHQRVTVSLDGEVAAMETPLHYRMRPGVLRVLVPEDSQEPREGPEVSG